MFHASRRSSGFTLIELLTVIAIIGILAAISAVAFPRAIMSAKIATLEANFNAIRQIMVNYYAENATYPPAYGYLTRAAIGQDPAVLTDAHHELRPYMYMIGQFNNRDLYDNFARSFDADDDGSIGPLEYQPPGIKAGPNSFTFATTLYDGSGAGSLLQQTERPLIYIPVNLRQVEEAARFWYQQNPNDPRPNDLSIFNQMRFPPATYNAFVLMSVGPNENTFGLLPDSVSGSFNPRYTYHILGIMAYFMATRDADDNGLLDFEYRARTREGEAKNPNNLLPDPQRQNGQGPVIFVAED